MIPVYRPYLHGNLAAYVNECIETGWISSRGAFIARFEQAFASYVGVNEAASVSNGTVALHLALLALEIGHGDEVIVPSFTYIAAVNAIIQTGAKPVFVDSLSETLQIDPNAVKAAITPRTRAVMVVHLYGHPCDMDAIVNLCDDHSLLLVEDCAEAFGARWKGRHVGSFGDAATFSFFGNKTITTGEGGMVLARDRKVMARCRHLKNQGVSPTREYWHDALAYNYRMTNIQAAIGLAQIELADEILEKKKAVAAAYSSRLCGLPLRFHHPVGDVRHSFWMCSIIADQAEDRNVLRAFLTENGIETRPFFPLAHLMPHCAAEGSFPIGENLSACGLNLPSFPDMTDTEIAIICSRIRDYFKSSRRAVSRPVDIGYA